MDFKVGDKVRHKTFGKGIVVETESGIVNDSVLVQFFKQNKFLHNGTFCKGIYPDHSCYHFRKDKLEELELDFTFKKQDLLYMPIGTKITTDKCEILIKDNLKESYEIYFENSESCLCIDEINEDLTILDRALGNKIVKVEMPTYSTVYEEKEPKEMTIEEIEEQLGYKIKIKGE